MGAAVQGHRLREDDAAGVTLVEERAIAPALRLQARSPFAADWGWRASAGVWAARADYDGRTQSGVPIESRTRTSAGDIDLAVERAVATGWTVDGGLRWELFRRRIEGVSGGAGLDERLWLPLLQLGAGWRDDTTTIRGLLRAGGPAPLDVRFDAGVYDRVELHSGRATGWAIDAEQVLGSGWALVGGAERLLVRAGAAATLRRDGQAVGRVTPPQWTRERVWFGLRRALG